MIPFHFGADPRRLFGMFQVGTQAPAQGVAVLICNPFGQEAIRAHRLVRVLAERLCRAGVDVLRFDAYGTGDAAGDDEEGELEGWSRDVLTAHEELVSRSSARRFCWLGLRLGATIAITAAHQAGAAVHKLVLWEPIVDGIAYRQLLRTKHVDTLEEAYSLPDPAWRRSLDGGANAYADEAVGFAVSPTLHGQLLALNAETLRIPVGTDTRVIADPTDVAVQRWIALQRQTVPQIGFATLAHDFDWNASSAQNTALVPPQALHELVLAIVE